MVDELCTTENEEFITYFEMIEDNVEEIKQKSLNVIQGDVQVQFRYLVFLLEENATGCHLQLSHSVAGILEVHELLIFFYHS